MALIRAELDVFDVIINPDNILHLEDLPKDPFFDAFKQGLLSDKPFGMIIRSDGEVKLWEQK